jgi:hypothetical protein
MKDLMGKNLYHHQNISWIVMFNIKTKLLKFDDRAENDNNEGTDESNRCEMIVDSLSFEFVSKTVQIIYVSCSREGTDFD